MNKVSRTQRLLEELRSDYQRVGEDANTSEWAITFTEHLWFEASEEYGWDFVQCYQDQLRQLITDTQNYAGEKIDAAVPEQVRQTINNILETDALPHFRELLRQQIDPLYSEYEKNPPSDCAPLRVGG